MFFLKSFVLYILFIPAGIGAVLLFGRLPDVFHRALLLFVKILPAVGVSLVLSKLSVKALDQYFLLGFACAAVAGQLFHAPVLVTLCTTAAAGWVGARFSERKS